MTETKESTTYPLEIERQNMLTQSVQWKLRFGGTLGKIYWTLLLSHRFNGIFNNQTE